MKSNLSSFWLCYRCRDPIFSLKKPHTRSLENKETLKFHSDTFDRKRETVIFAQLKDFSKHQNKLTTSWNDSIAILLNHQPVCSQSIKKIGIMSERKLVKSLPKDRSLSIALSSPDRGLKLSEAEQKGTEGRGSCGTNFTFLSSDLLCLTRRKHVLSPLWYTRDGTKQGSWKPRREIFQKTSAFDPYWVTWWVLLFFLFFFFVCFFLSWLGEGCSSINIFCCHLSWNANDTGTRAANGSCSEGSLKNILCIWSPHRQWSRTANDPWWGPQMIPPEKRGMAWSLLPCFYSFISYSSFKCKKNILKA